MSSQASAMTGGGAQLLARTNSNMDGNSNQTTAMNQQLVSTVTATGNHNINNSGMNRNGNTARNSNQQTANSSNNIRNNQMGTLNDNGNNGGNGGNGNTGTGSVRNTSGNNDTSNLNLTTMDAHQQQQQQQHHHHHNNSILVASRAGTNQGSGIDNRNNQHPQHNVANQRATANIISNNRMVNAPIVSSAPPLVLSLSQVGFVFLMVGMFGVDWECECNVSGRNGY